MGENCETAERATSRCGAGRGTKPKVAAAFVFAFAGVSAAIFQVVRARAGARAPLPTIEDINSTQLDIFMRSYRGDIQWLEFSAASLAGSIFRSPDVIRRVVLVVPPSDVSLFHESLNEIWHKRGLTASVRKRWVVTASQVHIDNDSWFNNPVTGRKSPGYEEQILDKLNADRYSDADYVVFLDTDVVLQRDLTRDQVFDSQGRPKLVWRNRTQGTQSEGAWNLWMQGHVYYMFGWGPQDYKCSNLDFMCTLGLAYDIRLFPHLRNEIERHVGKEWEEWHALAYSSTGTDSKGPVPITDFDAMGYILCRDFHDKVAWIELSNQTDWSKLAKPIQTWSWESNATRIASVKQYFNCLVQHQHDGSGVWKCSAPHQT